MIKLARFWRIKVTQNVGKVYKHSLGGYNAQLSVEMSTFLVDYQQ